jgi:hypothetical protein
MVARSLEPQIVLDEIGILTLRLAPDRKARQILGAPLIKIESQERLGISPVGCEREAVLLCRYVAHVAILATSWATTERIIVDLYIPEVVGLQPRPVIDGAQGSLSRDLNKERRL